MQAIPPNDHCVHPRPAVVWPLWLTTKYPLYAFPPINTSESFRITLPVNSSLYRSHVWWALFCPRSLNVYETESLANIIFWLPDILSKNVFWTFIYSWNHRSGRNFKSHSGWYPYKPLSCNVRDPAWILSGLQWVFQDEMWESQDGLSLRRS